MKKKYIITILGLTSTLAFSQIDNAQTVVSTEVKKATEKIKDTAKVVVSEKITEKLTPSTDSIPASVLKDKEDIQKNSKITMEDYFSFEGKNEGQIILKSLSTSEVLIFEDFASEELKTKMLALDKENVSDVFGIVYKPITKEVGTKKLDADGEQIEKTVTKVFEMISAKAQEKH